MDQMEQELLMFIDEQQADLFEELARLIRFDTQNFISHGREKLCQDYIYEQMTNLGFKTERYVPDSVPGILEHCAYQSGRGMNERENVTCIYPGTDATRPPFMLAAHTDTMPVGDRDEWTVDPFGGIISDGKIYGLGAGDNKAGLAASLFILRIFKHFSVSFVKPMLVTAYVDEEYGGGGGALAACLKYPCESFINLDGGNFELWVASLGGGGFAIKVKTDFSTDTASVAFRAIADIHEALLSYGRKLSQKLHEHPLYTGSDMERSAMRISGIRVGEEATNLGSAFIHFVLYTNDDEATVRADLQAHLNPLIRKYTQQGIQIAQPVNITRFFEADRTDDQLGLLPVLKQSVKDACKRDIQEKGACLSDLSIFLRYGSLNSLNFGIMRDFALPGGAHQPNEFVYQQDLLDYTKSLALFILRYAGK